MSGMSRGYVGYKEIGEFIENTIVGCKFVGISSDGELFIEFEHDDGSLKLSAAELLRSEFEEVTRVTFVERVNLEQAKKMVGELNMLLKNLEEDGKGLLDIGDFE